MTGQLDAARHPAATPPADASPAVSPIRHLAYIDGVRALLALFVVGHHAYLTIWPLDLVSRYGDAPRGLRWLLFGRLAVDAFITVSGFCLMLPAARRGGTLRGGAGRFFARRTRRILPPYFASAALSLLLIYTVIGSKTGTHWDTSIPVSGRDVLANLTMLTRVMPDTDGKINHVFWSVQVEWWTYFLFPLLLTGYRRFGPVATAAAAVVGGLTVSRVVRETSMMGLYPSFVGLFAMGMAAAAICVDPPTARRFAKVPMAWIGAAMLAVPLAMHWRGGHAAAMQSAVDTVAGAAVAGWLVALYRTDTPVRQALSWPPLVAVGVFSYSLYLVHAPLLQVAWQVAVRPFGLGGTTALAVLLAAAIPLTLVGAFGFFLCFERPFMSRRQRAAVNAEMVQAVSSSEAEPVAVETAVERHG